MIFAVADYERTLFDVALVTREHPPGTLLEAAYVRGGRMLTGTGTLRARS